MSIKCVIVVYVGAGKKKDMSRQPWRNRHVEAAEKKDISRQPRRKIHVEAGKRIKHVGTGKYNRYDGHATANRPILQTTESSLASSPPYENLLPLFVGSIVNYFSNSTEATKLATSCFSRPQPTTDNGILDGCSNWLPVTHYPLQSSTPLHSANARHKSVRLCRESKRYL